MTSVEMTSEALASHLKAAMQTFINQDELSVLQSDPIAHFLALLPQEIRERLPVEHEQLLREGMMASPDSPAARDGGGLGCWGCWLGLWTAVVGVCGGAIAVTAGAAIAPIIAVEAGLIPVLAAMTGISEAWIAAAGIAGGATVDGLINALCAQMGAC